MNECRSYGAGEVVGGERCAGECEGLRGQDAVRSRLRQQPRGGGRVFTTAGMWRSEGVVNECM